MLNSLGMLVDVLVLIKFCFWTRFAYKWAIYQNLQTGLVLSVTHILRAALTKFRVYVCVTTPKPLNRFAYKLYNQIERLTLIAIGYSDLKYLPCHI